MAGIGTLVRELVRAHGEPPAAASDPYAIVLHENAGYLIDDDRRDALHARIVALAPDPVALLSADRAALLAIAHDGGMRPEERVERWRAIAEITLDEADGDLLAALRRLPIARAKRLLARYPSIGAPGVDRILLFSEIVAVAQRRLERVARARTLRRRRRGAAVRAWLPRCVRGAARRVR